MTKCKNIKKKKHCMNIPVEIKLQCFIEKYWIIFRTVFLFLSSYFLAKILLTAIIIRPK